MDGIERIIAYIKSDSEAECQEISRAAAEECERIRADCARLEQEEYWKHINAGSKETEQRLEQLRNLAAMESRKQILATQQEMVDKAFSLAAKKLLELPEREYAKLVRKHATDADCSADEIVERYRKELSLKIVSALFE